MARRVRVGADDEIRTPASTGTHIAEGRIGFPHIRLG